MSRIPVFLLSKTFQSKTFYLLMFFLLLIIYYRSFGVEVSSSQETDGDLMSVYQSCFYSSFLLFLVTPSFLILIDTVYFNFFNQYKVLLRFQSIWKWWEDLYTSLLLFSFAFSLILNLFFIFSIGIHGGFFDFTGRFLAFMLVGFLLQLTGFSIISGLYQLMIQVFNHYAAFLLICLILLTPFLLRFVLNWRHIYTLPELIFLGNMQRVDGAGFELGIIFPALIALSALVHFMIFYLIKNKELNWRI